MNENNQQKLDKIKAHIHKYQIYYIVGGVIVTVAGGTYLGYKIGSARNIQQQINNDPTQVNVLAWKPQQTLAVHIEALGDPGNIIQDIDTGIIYASQNQAAKELGVTASRLSSHLKGELDHVNGHKFVKLGKAMVSEDAV